MQSNPTLQEAFRFYRQGNRLKARQVCHEYLRKWPGDANGRHLMAILSADDGNADEAIRILREILLTTPNDGRVHRTLGKVLVRAGRMGEAVAATEAALELIPHDSDIYLDLSTLHLTRREPAKAEAVLRDAMARSPSNTKVLSNLAGLLSARGERAEAILRLQQAVAVEPSSAQLHFNLAIGLKAANEIDGAIEHYRQAIALQPDLADAHLNLANLLIDLGRVDEAAAFYESGTKARRAVGGRVDDRQETFRKTNPSKLHHDIEQLNYLIERGRLPAQYRAVVQDYQSALAALPPWLPGMTTTDLPVVLGPKLAPHYNRLVYGPESAAVPDSAVNPALDRAAIEGDYRRNAPGITYLDNFLTAEALEQLHRFCLEATVWFQCRYAGGYLGAFMDDGFCSPLLLRIAAELPRSLPGIFGKHTLRKQWAFKYDSRLSGIPIHADFAAINVNFWVTPDDANLDPDGGGLVVWDKEAPLDWDFARYNNDQPAIRQFLSKNNARAINVPHRQNRAVIFNSDLFHETARLRFRSGYENRRINITMLYGRRSG
ncbi:MAG: tetratricopeptide repeat protein [Dongiaceae bacterium]